MKVEPHPDEFGKILTPKQLAEFREKCRRNRYDLTGDYGNLETWTPPPDRVSHVFYVSARGEVSYISASITGRCLPFERAMDLVSGE